MSRTLGAVDNYPVGQGHCVAAETAMRRLTEIGFHRAVKFPDLLIAAIAETSGLGVLHYDQDFEVLSQNGVFDIETEWVVPPGTADEPS